MGGGEAGEAANSLVNSLSSSIIQTQKQKLVDAMTSEFHKIIDSFAK